MTERFAKGQGLNNSNPIKISLKLRPSGQVPGSRGQGVRMSLTNGDGAAHTSGLGRLVWDLYISALWSCMRSSRIKWVGQRVARQESLFCWRKRVCTFYIHGCYDLCSSECPISAEHPLVGASTSSDGQTVSFCTKQQQDAGHVFLGPNKNTSSRCNRIIPQLVFNLYSEHALMGGMFCLVSPCSFERSTAMTGGGILSFILKSRLKIALRWNICVWEEPVTSSA